LKQEGEFEVRGRGGQCPPWGLVLRRKHLALGDGGGPARNGGTTDGNQTPKGDSGNERGPGAQSSRGGEKRGGGPGSGGGPNLPGGTIPRPLCDHRCAHFLVYSRACTGMDLTPRLRDRATGGGTAEAWGQVRTAPQTPTFTDPRKSGTQGRWFGLGVSCWDKGAGRNKGKRDSPDEHLGRPTYRFFFPGAVGGTFRGPPSG